MRAGGEMEETVQPVEVFIRRQPLLAQTGVWEISGSAH